MEGAEPREPITPYYRDYLLAKHFGFGFEQIQDSPAAWLDWLLAVHGAVTEAEVRVQERAQRG